MMLSLCISNGLMRFSVWKESSFTYREMFSLGRMNETLFFCFKQSSEALKVFIDLRELDYTSRFFH
jgi:hypothetical protein